MKYQTFLLSSVRSALNCANCVNGVSVMFSDIVSNNCTAIAKISMQMLQLQQSRMTHVTSYDSDDDVPEQVGLSAVADGPARHAASCASCCRRVDDQCDKLPSTDASTVN